MRKVPREKSISQIKHDSSGYVTLISNVALDANFQIRSKALGCISVSCSVLRIVVFMGMIRDTKFNVHQIWMVCNVTFLQ